MYESRTKSGSVVTASTRLMGTADVMNDADNVGSELNSSARCHRSSGAEYVDRSFPVM